MDQLFEILMILVNPTKRMDKYYLVRSQRGLFGPTLYRQWGPRSSNRHQMMINTFDTWNQVHTKGLDIVLQKLRKGYQITSMAGEEKIFESPEDGRALF